MSLFWRLALGGRKQFGKVLDMGAGDCRFLFGGKFKKYVGVEIDRNRSQGVILPKNAKLIHNCAFKHRDNNYDACIGNPPYVRHHDIENPWKDDTVLRIKNDLGVSLNKHCNLYLYFLCLGLRRCFGSSMSTWNAMMLTMTGPSSSRPMLRRRGIITTMPPVNSNSFTNFT